MNAQSVFQRACLALLAAGTVVSAQAFDSGSSGADGLFNPSDTVEVPLPPSGIFNFTDVNIPAGVTVTFARNASNTPVRILASGDVTIDGAISVNGFAGQNGPSGGRGGLGGPGGFDGGHGGLRLSTQLPEGGDGAGPGAGTGGPNCGNSVGCEGGSGGFGSAGANGGVSGTQGRGGPAYGNSALLPLIGGSGGGGGAGQGGRGGGGGGGGGALLIAASGTVTLNGSVTASGGTRGLDGGSGQRASRGGFGSGGAIRLIATTVQGEGSVSASNGRIRIEAESLLRLANTTPAFTSSQPQTVLVAGAPQLRIASIGAQPTPAVVSGFRDVVLPGITTGPVDVVVETVNVPLASIVTVRATPERGASVSADGSGITGPLASGTATVSINLPAGNSRLTAQANFTITAELGDQYAPFAQGERVASIELSTLGDAGTHTTYVTVSGKRFTWGPRGLVN